MNRKTVNKMMPPQVAVIKHQHAYYNIQMIKFAHQKLNLPSNFKLGLSLEN